MKLSHFSDNPVERMRFSCQDGKGAGMPKPRGLWVSVDGPDDWPSWCESEGFRNCEGQYRYAVHLAGHHRVLVLDTPHEMIAFDQKYGVEVGHLGNQIDWARVARDHDGLVIAPYHPAIAPNRWSLQREERFSWYDGWCCASGCVWHPRAVDRLELIHAPRLFRHSGASRNPLDITTTGPGLSPG